MKRIWMFILISVFMFACKQEMQEPHAVVSGQFTGLCGEMVRLKELKIQRIIPVDSVMTNNQGSFMMEFFPQENGFYLFSVADREPVSLVIGVGDSINLVLDTSDIYGDFKVDGNKSSLMLMEYHRKTGETNRAIESLRNLLFEKQGEPGFAEIKFGIDATLDSALKRHRGFTEQLIRNNPGELASLILINKTIAGQPVFSPEDDKGLYFLIEDSLTAKYPDNSHVKAHVRRMNNFRQEKLADQEAAARVGVGREVPQFILPDIHGNSVSLSSLKENPVILFFWASWSPESRADLQMLKTIYNRHKVNGLEIFAVSLDHNQNFWKAAVENEALQWVNVCDAGGLQGPTATLFNLRDGLPYYYLIDKNGKIVHKTADFSALEESVIDLLHPEAEL